MAEARASATLPCTAEEFLAFVLDVERYRAVDDKIGPIDWVQTEGNITDFRFRPTLPGLPPAPKTVSRMRLTPGQRIDIAYAPRPHNRLAGLLADFSASFACEPHEEGVHVTRIITIDPFPGAKQILDRYLSRRLQASIERELALARTVLTD